MKRQNGQSFLKALPVFNTYGDFPFSVTPFCRPCPPRRPAACCSARPGRRKMSCRSLFACRPPPPCHFPRRAGFHPRAISSSPAPFPPPPRRFPPPCRSPRPERGRAGRKRKDPPPAAARLSCPGVFTSVLHARHRYNAAAMLYIFNPAPRASASALRPARISAPTAGQKKKEDAPERK